MIIIKRRTTTDLIRFNSKNYEPNEQLTDLYKLNLLGDTKGLVLLEVYKSNSHTPDQELIFTQIGAKQANPVQ